MYKKRIKTLTALLAAVLVSVGTMGNAVPLKPQETHQIKSLF